jgi:hypothetical protein
MSDRDQPKAAQRTGASLMTRVDAADGTGSSPRRFLEGLPHAAQRRRIEPPKPVIWRIPVCGMSAKGKKTRMKG